MRVLLLIDSLFTGGAEYSTLLFYQWLVEQKKAEVRIICLKKAHPSYDPEDFGFRDPEYLPSGSYKSIKALKSKVTDFEPDVLHSVLYKANILGRFTKMLYGGFIHVESLVNETYSKHRLKDPNISRFKLEFYRLFDFVTQLHGVDHFHANGNSVANHYKKKINISSDRMTIIPRGRFENKLYNNENSKDKIRSEFSAREKLLLINVGRHEYQKGQDVLLQALGSLKKQDLEKVKLLIVGRRGNYSALLEKLVTRYGLQGSVVFTGHRNDVNALLTASDIFVFPSRFEGLPGALIEAEAAGLPIIISDIPNNLEVAESNENALVFKVNDHKELAVCIERMINNKTIRSKMGKKSRVIFKNKFRIEKIHERMFKMLKAI